MEGAAALERGRSARQEVDSAVVRFAGDSGDGMQLTGGRFTMETALEGNALATFPDFPAEIRAPAGTTFGVSAYQINFGTHGIKTAGDMVDVLVAMNPAALKVNLADVRGGGLVEVLQDIQAQGLARWIGISTTLPHLPAFVEMGVFDTFQIPRSPGEYPVSRRGLAPRRGGPV